MRNTAKTGSNGAVRERLPRFKAWAMRLPQDELAEKFAQLLATHLVARKSHRDKERDWNNNEHSLENSLSECQNIIELYECVQENQRDQRSEGGKNKSKEKQEAKANALALWKERDAGKRPELRTVEQFATEVMRLWPVLTSHKVICGWSSNWTKEARAGKTPTN